MTVVFLLAALAWAVGAALTGDPAFRVTATVCANVWVVAYVIVERLDRR